MVGCALQLPPPPCRRGPRKDELFIWLGCMATHWSQSHPTTEPHIAHTLGGALDPGQGSVPHPPFDHHVTWRHVHPQSARIGHATRSSTTTAVIDHPVASALA